jgi:hypothetical protein
LIEDLRVNAPHVKVAVVMPGHVGTGIVVNSGRVLGRPDFDEMPEADLEPVRAQMRRRGFPADDLSADQLRQIVKAMVEGFRNNAPTTASQAATVILDGVRAGRWRILVGEDAKAQDERVRANPDGAYEHTEEDFGSAILRARPAPQPVEDADR